MEPTTTAMDTIFFENLDHTTTDPQSGDTMTMTTTWWPTTQQFFMEENYGQILNNVSTDIYCEENWAHFWSSNSNFDPRLIHMTLLPIIFLLVCLINVISFLVLTRQRMRGEPTHKILAAIALTDLLLVGQELVSILVNRFGDEPSKWRDGPEEDAVSKTIFGFWIFFMLFHTWTIYLTLATAVWRWFGVVHGGSNLGRDWLTVRGVNWTIFTGFLVGTLAFAPFFFLRFLPHLHSHGQTMRLIYAIFVKLIPCLTLTILTVALIRSLQNARDLRQLQDSPLSNIWSLNGPNVFEPVQKKKSQKNKKDTVLRDEEKAEMESEKMTKMLVVIFIIFILTEILPGLNMFVGVLAGQTFFDQCQEPIVPILNLIQALRTLTLFPILLALSLHFRACLAQLVRRVVPTGGLQISANGGSSPPPPPSLTTEGNGASGQNGGNAGDGKTSI